MPCWMPIPARSDLCIATCPLTSIHPNALPLPKRFLCARDQDAYWEFHDILFDNQALLNDQAGTVLDQAELQPVRGWTWIP